MPAFPKVFDCGIRLVPQDKPEDCWAECLSGIFGFLGAPVSQDDVRKKVFGKDVDHPLGPLDIPQALALFGVSCVGPTDPLAPEQLGAEVTADPVRPVLLGLAWSPPLSGGHAILVVGWKPLPVGVFLVEDPFFGPAELSYEEILTAYGNGRCVAAYGRFVLREKS
jgi:hypothetical protein